MTKGFSKPNSGFLAALYSRLSNPLFHDRFFSYDDLVRLMRDEFPMAGLKNVSQSILTGERRGDAPWEIAGKGLIRVKSQIGASPSSPSSPPETNDVKLENFLLVKRLAKLEDGTLLVQDDDTLKVYKLEALS